METKTINMGTVNQMYNENAMLAIKAYDSAAKDMTKLDNVLTLVCKYWDKNKATPVALSEVFGVFTDADGNKLFDKPGKVGTYIRAAVKGKCAPIMKNAEGKIRVWAQKTLVNKYAEPVKDVNGRGVKPIIRIGGNTLIVDYARVLKAYKLADIVTFIAQNESVLSQGKVSVFTEADFFEGCNSAEDVTKKCAILEAAYQEGTAAPTDAPAPTAEPAPTDAPAPTAAPAPTDAPAPTAAPVRA